MNPFNFVNHPILIAGYSVCVLLLVLSFIKKIPFRAVFLITLFVCLTGLSIYSLIAGSSYIEVICFLLLFFIVASIHLLKRKEKE